MNKEFNITYYDLPTFGIADQQWLLFYLQPQMPINSTKYLHRKSITERYLNLTT
ncbi:MAG: hypothetical protein IT222_12600 [Crocinitomix sp.]|nr:hypothetical protein [Crocinitomix sp.]